MIVVRDPITHTKRYIATNHIKLAGRPEKNERRIGRAQ
jgi:hypothetical protein